MKFRAASYRFVPVWITCALLVSCSAIGHPSAAAPAAEPSSAAPATPGAQSPASSSSSPRSPPSSSPPASGQGSIPSGYDKYANARYGFATLWPASLKIQAPPEDGAGQAWVSSDGQVQMAAYGANNVLSYSPEQDEAADARTMSVVYRHISGNVVTVSGYKNDRQTIVYQRDWVGPGAIDTLYWSYPASEKAEWDAAVTLTALTFQPGDLDTAH